MGVKIAVSDAESGCLNAEIWHEDPSFVLRVLPALKLVHLNDTERHKALVLSGRVSRERRVLLCDAISAVVVRERLGSIPCLAFDDDFQRLGLTVT